MLLHKRKRPYGVGRLYTDCVLADSEGCTGGQHRGMPHAATVADLSPAIHSLRSLLCMGWTERAIDREARGGRLQRIRRGWYMDAAEWRDLWTEGRHLAHSIAVARDSAGLIPLSHTSAAVVWGLPLYRTRPVRVHETCASPSRVSSGVDVHRHVAPLPAADVVMRDGLRVTSLARTVLDCIRVLPPEAAVALADAAERTMAQVRRDWDEDAVAAWRRGMEGRVLLTAGARGIRQARWVSAFADGRAQLPGESVSRLQLVRIGFAVPELRAPDGRRTGAGTTSTSGCATSVPSASSTGGASTPMTHSAAGAAWRRCCWMRSAARTGSGARPSYAWRDGRTSTSRRRLVWQRA